LPASSVITSFLTLAVQDLDYDDDKGHLPVSMINVKVVSSENFLSPIQYGPNNGIFGVCEEPRHSYDVICIKICMGILDVGNLKNLQKNKNKK